MRHPGIEPGAPRWQRGILPLNQWRFFGWQNDPGGTRTPNRLIRSPARYPLRHRTSKWVEVSEQVVLVSWPSGLRRSTQVRVRPAGVGSNPTGTTIFVLNKNAFDRGRTGDLGIMRPTRCQLRHES